MTNEATKSDKAILPLDPKGKETLLALLTCRTKTKAAEQLGINRTTLYERIDRYNLGDIIEKIPERALQTLQIGSERAAEVLVEELENIRNRMEASKEILDRVGLTKKEGPKVAQQFNVNGEEMKVEFIEKK